MQPNHEIIFTEIPGLQGALGVITLQRPQVLNALNDAMLHALQHQLALWAENISIKAVVIRAAPGRAFCAGGDIRFIYKKKIANDPTLMHFFQDEYAINQQIFHFPKPYIALLNGITMGGGAGLSIHGSHRVATENMSFAMPETRIGYFPDVGASYFLSRLPYKIGYYLGLTGAEIHYNDCLALHLVDNVIASTAEESLLKLLAESALPTRDVVTEIIRSVSVAAPVSTLLAHCQEIENCFSKKNVEEILQALHAEGSLWCASIAADLMKKSPASLKITLRALQKGAHYTFDECMQMEKMLSLHFLQSHDFPEGIRAAMIDKDNTPQWIPATLDKVSDEFVERYFIPPSGASHHLPPEGEGIY